ncbi:MAG: hypothetical protein MI784_09760 [Cytophagales bacterium]|nr:hypothetical protein [Cytophagales bacterium]
MKDLLNDKFKIIITPQSASLPGNGKLVAESGNFKLKKSSKIKVGGRPAILEIKEKDMPANFKCTAVGPLPPDSAQLTSFVMTKGAAGKLKDASSDNKPLILNDFEASCACAGTYKSPNGTPTPYNGSCKMKILFAGQVKVKGK